jgi:hypothetical protein
LVFFQTAAVVLKFLKNAMIFRAIHDAFLFQKKCRTVRSKWTIRHFLQCPLSQALPERRARFFNPKEA